MVRFIHAMKIGVVAMAAALTLGAASQAQADAGRIHAKILKAGFIVGVGGGNGTLTYPGENIP